MIRHAYRQSKMFIFVSFVVVFVVGSLFIRWKLAFRYLRSYGIHGPCPELYFGNSRQISAAKGPLKFIEVNLSKYGQVFGYYNGIRPNIVVKNLELLKQIMVKQFDCFVDRDEIIFPTMIQRSTSIRAGGLFASQGDQWKRQRKIISKSFNSSNIRRMSPLIEESCVSLIKKFGEFTKHGRSFDISQIFGSYTMEVILATGFGHKIDLINGKEDELTKASECVFEAMRKGNAEPIVALLSNFPFLWNVLRAVAMRTRNAASYALLEDKIAELVEKRLESIRHNEDNHYDLLQLLIDAKADSDDEDDQPGTKAKNTLSEIEVASISTSFLLAGHETARSTLAFIFHLLAVNPIVQEKLHSEINEFYSRNEESTLYEAAQSIPYVDMIVQESMRMYPAAPIVARKAARDIEIDGQKFPKGCAVVIPVMAIHYSPEYWPEPTLFKPERFLTEEKEKRHPFAHIPFGYGPRSCIGTKLALMETKMALTALVRRYKFVESPDTEKPLQTSIGVTLAPTNGVYLILENRS